MEKHHELILMIYPNQAVKEQLLRISGFAQSYLPLCSTIYLKKTYYHTQPT